ncbi:MAG: adenosylcobinamide-phosphate synthase CbiB [Hoeflea sp.]|uniref:adenosylcobinamide-phosphate synthase CbiB n=1 Tax=Hoeflea sp. TaxID=1940281 RepID=UPI001DAF2084|nr:adenosylcobinamide-phosphate synthase CbiB [Hoeflea sp.]MBU4531087.1 adenosylcobinamide-phosphate synthase CbiB [Alphaproteobacteria bacterium]MBU4542862.1 adenosylcobinamide-phosphate synthase CbiB [Alphaproteobacteria bacterium]MBU4552674.1 adenosylcobinamide-phosphate synthase CbiB [Alphaproteobacteria bacterium]MBV1722979.1 adenosylcobinamide-phosphate synthase CbiB [Hoeflea sp.]MBV1762890.1 adenosylcobinamide-phosphate synthase CbiB [Hoeflea sp.]
MGHLPVLFAALVLDRLVGDPDWLWRRISHPVVLFGAAIGFADRRYNHVDDSPELRRRKGRSAIIVLLALAALGGGVLAHLFDRLGGVGVILEILVVSVFLAQKSLADHVAAVADGLYRDGLAGGRKAVSMIVGRDPDALDEAGVSRAAIESLSENFSDGIVAPALWFAFFGLPGLMAYKMLNTADSMIGHLNDRHRDFGRAAAKLDDLANWPASRLSALLVAAGAGLVRGWSAMKRAATSALTDQGLHRSPNAGWPEAAMAGGLDLMLGGPRRYGGELVMEAGLHASGRQNAGARDIVEALEIFRRACDCLALIVLAAVAVSY